LQFGFIVGTLVFALLAIADRFSARLVFLLCSLAGALCTLGAWAQVRDQDALMAWRFATGFFLAGIYPVGMKIAASGTAKAWGRHWGCWSARWCWVRPAPHGLRAWGAVSCPGTG
jgi:MFS transporter, DHA1 family, inner membrane transport protein